MNKTYIGLLLLILAVFGVHAQGKTDSTQYQSYKQKKAQITRAFTSHHFSFKVPYGTAIDTIKENTVEKKVELAFNENFITLPMREDIVREIESALPAILDKWYPGYKAVISVLDGYTLEDMIPNLYRSVLAKDAARLAKSTGRPVQVIRNISKPVTITRGLQDKNIVLWHSHGWYYDAQTKKWEWQRPRLFTMVEDFVPMSFTLPYIIPMLENAGANVYVPRERDLQTHEVVVDNDTKQDVKSKAYTELPAKAARTCGAAGFKFAKIYDTGENPFLMGTSRSMKTSPKANATFTWLPDIPAEGDYAVYISYTAAAENSANAHYTLWHAGGKTEFHVNQQIGGSSWYYIGTFRFLKGKHKDSGCMVLSNDATDGAFVTADAVRFGGGMSNIARDGEVSGRPKFTEGARYWLQYAGMPDTLVYKLSRAGSDYVDDYQCRAEYANYLHGAPFGPTRNRQAGLGIPIDLSFAFHTDAGITHSDTVIGSLSIYSLTGNDNKNIFADSVSRLANRDFADILQTEIVRDIRTSFDDSWVRRQLKNGEYSESVRPNVPSALLELLSHQNFADMKYVLDPAFRFTVARAIYKGMVKYIASSRNEQCVIEPLPVKAMSAKLNVNSSITVSWLPVNDTLEPTAAPTGYIVYKRIDNAGFDNGTYTEKPEYTVNNIQAGKVYSFKVTAVNAGGESVPSEIVAAGKGKSASQVLIINGFHRVAGPAWVNTPGFTGFLHMLDEGVPDKWMAGYTGTQYDFNPNSEFLTNEAAGHGASGAEREGQVFGGNTFDYPAVHGASVLHAGYSFSSCSDDACTGIDKQYVCVDVIMGKQKETHWQRAKYDSLFGMKFPVFTRDLMKHLAGYLDNGGNVFITGSYIGSDVFKPGVKDSSTIAFVEKYLRYKLQGSYASKNGLVEAANDKLLKRGTTLSFNTALSPAMYTVDAPDALLPLSGAKTIARYRENSFFAGILYKQKFGVVALGFPFESVIGQESRDDLMKNMLEVLVKK